MLDYLRDIEKAIDGFPKDGRPVSASVDPRPLRELCKNLENAIRVCQDCLHYYTKQATGKNVTPRHQLDDRDPRRTYTEKTWSDRRERLLQKITTCQELLAYNYPLADATAGATAAAAASSAAKSPNTKDSARPLDLAYSLQQHLLLCWFARIDDASAARYLGSVAADNEYLKQHHLAVVEKLTLGEYCTSQLLQSLYMLIGSFNDLERDERLLQYILSLEIRAAIISLYANTALVHDDEQYRRQVGTRQGVTYYVANYRLLMVFTSVFLALHERLYYATLLPCVYPTDNTMIPVSREHSLALRRWFRARMERIHTRRTNEWLQKMYTELCVWPAERELHMIENPHDKTIGSLSILKRTRINDAHPLMRKRRNVQYNQIILDAERPPADIILDLLKADDPRRQKESLLLQLSLVVTFERVAADAWNGVDFFQYCVLSRDLSLYYRTLLVDQRCPRLVQVFNHFQLAYRAKFYYYNSFIESLCAWFQIMNDDQHKGALSKMISIRPLYKEIFEPPATSAPVPVPVPVPAPEPVPVPMSADAPVTFSFELS